MVASLAQMFTEGDDRWLLTGGVARALGCSPDHVRHLDRIGQLRAVRVAGVRLFDREDVERVRRQRAEKPRRRAPAPTAA